VFLAVLVLAFVVFLRAGQKQWFVLDEWDFFSSREHLDAHALLSPHIGHWVTVPYLVFRALYQAFGLNSYTPYVLVSIGSHLGLAAMVRAVMRRAGVGPWLATAFAAAFALFGTGSENVVWAFQIGFTGSLAFGVAHLLLADHDGPFDRRDWLGLLCGALAVMSSTPGVLMIVAVGIAVGIRRGRRMLLLHTQPLVVLFAIWAGYWIGYVQVPISPGHPNPPTLAGFVVNGFRGTYGGLGWWPVVGIALFAMTVVGVVVATKLWPRPAWVRMAAGPLAMLVSGVLFIALAGYERSGQYGPDFAYQSRYLHMLAAFVLPITAFAAQAIIVRWPTATAAVVLLPLLGIPGNIAAADTPIPYIVPSRDLILTLPRVPIAAEAPADAVPGIRYAPVNYTIGFLRDAAADGKLPRPDALDPSLVAEATIQIALGQLGDDPSKPCRPIGTPLDLVLQPGDQIRLGPKPVPITVITDAGPQTATVDPAYGGTLEAQVPNLHITAPPGAADQLELCR
jgi:spore maturation protein SpmB